MRCLGIRWRTGTSLVALLAFAAGTSAVALAGPPTPAGDTLPSPHLLSAEGAPPAAPVMPPPPPAALPPWLPRYDLDMHCDLAGHTITVRQRVTWTNRHQRPAAEIVFNAHSHYKVPDDEVGLLAKTLEIMRMTPSECLLTGEAPLEIRRASVDDAELPFHWQKDNNCALVVPLPKPVHQGETIALDLDFVFHLPQKQGRWGQWKGVTQLSNWQPVLAVYDEEGWHPTPFIPWHQPFFNEAGMFHVRATLPADQKLACSGWVAAEHAQDDGTKVVDIEAPGVRDFAFLCSSHFQDFACDVCGVHVHCLALPEHEHYARFIVQTACDVLPYYMKWFGPYPWPQLTFVESYFGWNGNECATLVMIDERVFCMPHLAHGYVEYLIAHETCHQWWYNLLGTNGYCETWMDEAMANYFGHRYLNIKHGKNNNLLQYPAMLEWLPNIKRENYRFYELYGTLGRGEETPIIQDMPKFGHVITLFSMCYDKGGQIVGMIEERLGHGNEEAFLDFLHVIYKRYQYRILRVADFQHELEEYTGRPQEWQDFFHDWLYCKGMSDWCVERVDVEPAAGKGGLRWRFGSFLSCLHGDEQHKPCHVTVRLHQKAEYNEQTVLGICLDGGDGYQIRIPIMPQAHAMKFDEPPATVEMLPDNHVLVEIDLPSVPTQIAVDPDHVIPDRDPSNNYWKPPIRWRFTPLYTFLEENSLTCDYDRWNVIIGPWIYGSAYQEAWYTRSSMIGFRAGLYRTEDFTGGAYAAYRTDFDDIVVGADGLWDHWPWPTTQVGFNAEHRIATVENGQNNVNRATLFGRYVFQYGDSLYLPPMHYVEAFTDYQDNFLPYERRPMPHGFRYDDTATAGIHYNINYLTPYWDPEGGFQADATYEGGVVNHGKQDGLNLLRGQVSAVKCMPDLDGWLARSPGLDPYLGPGLRWLSDTRFAGRLFGAAGFPNQGEYFALGGADRFRGFDLRERQGSLAWVASLEWRVPLAKDQHLDVCDHLVGMRNLYAALYYDIGDALAGGHSYGPVAHGVGAALCLDLTWLGLVERSVLRLDMAKCVNENTPFQFWFAIVHPF